MANVNRVLLLGNLTFDPDLRYTTGGTPICALRLATNRTFRTGSGEQREETCYIDIDVFGKQAEPCGRYLKKGSQVYVEGRLRLDQWQDRQTGDNRSKLKVVAETVQFLDRRRDRGGPPSDDEYYDSQASRPPQDDGGEDGDDDNSEPEAPNPF